MLIDSHAHLHFDRFDEDRDEVIARAHDRGVNQIVTIGTHRESSQAAIELAERHESIYATAGVHPLAVEKFQSEDWQSFESMWTHPDVVAIGETGLDYYYTPETADQQRQLFERHLSAGQQFNLPVVVHIRDAFEDAFELLEAHLGDAGGIVHCFTGGPEECARALELGMYISLSGIATFKNAKALRDAIPMVPQDRLLVETDSPYLAPIPHRGKRCEPGFVYDTAKVVAALRGDDFETLCAYTVENTRKIFAKMKPI
ncbi:MAG: TatD family hydrolase [Bradymonadia bacterium]